MTKPQQNVNLLSSVIVKSSQCAIYIVKVPLVSSLHFTLTLYNSSQRYYTFGIILSHKLCPYSRVKTCKLHVWETRSAPLLTPTRQTIYVQRNIGARSRNPCCRGEAISITHSECVYVYPSSSMQSACAVFYCHLWPVCLYHIFPHYFTNGTIFGGGRGELLNIKCVLIFSTTFI
jgi:hypothetical protein